MRCPFCGNDVPDEFKFCSRCGNQLPAPMIVDPEPPKKKKTGLIAAIIAVVIIAVGVGGYFIYQNQPSTKLAKIRTTDPNGKEANVVLISEDGKSWYSMPDVNSPQGIYGCY